MFLLEASSQPTKTGKYLCTRIFFLDASFGFGSRSPKDTHLWILMHDQAPQAISKLI
jgi:hypothetical protein